MLGKGVSSLIAVALAMVSAASGSSITVKRTINELNPSVGDLKLDVSGCKKTDNYGCSEFDTEWGKNVSGKLHVSLRDDLKAGSHFIASVHIKTGIIPVPFTLKCDICGKPCSVKIPILEQDIEVPVPPCPIKKNGFDLPFAFPIPGSDPIPLTVGVDGIVNVYDQSGKELAAAHFSARAARPTILYASETSLQ